MRLYELMAIFPTEEAPQKEGIDLLKNELEKAGAVIESTGEIGERDLAYEIKKRKRGKYILYKVKLEPEKLASLNKVFQLNANLVKWLFVKVDGSGV